MQRCKALFAAAGVLTVSSVLVFTAISTGAASASSASSLPTMTVALNGKTVTIGGSTVSGAVNVVTTTTNEAAGGTFLYLLKPGETDAAFGQAVQVLAAHHGQLDYLNPYGTIVYDAYSPKGVSSGQVVLPAGNYVAVDSNSSASVPPHGSSRLPPRRARRRCRRLRPRSSPRSSSSSDRARCATARPCGSRTSGSWCTCSSGRRRRAWRRQSRPSR